jgi:hypothetical protein
VLDVCRTTLPPLVPVGDDLMRCHRSDELCDGRLMKAVPLDAPAPAQAGA